MTGFRTPLIAATLLLAACKGKGKDEASSDVAGQPPAGGPAAERRTLDLEGFAVDVSLPKGWTEAPFGGGVAFAAPGKELMPSNMFVAPGCQGDCSKVAENVATFVDTQRKMHEQSGYTVEVKAQGELPGGGRSFHLTVSRDSDVMDQVMAIAHQPGWDTAITCSATLRKADRANVATFASWCNDMKIAKR